MSNCLNTKVKDAAENDSLKELGHMQIVVKKLSTSQLVEPERQLALRLGATSGNITIKIIGNGYMATSLANLDDPTKRLTTTTVGTTLQPLYFCNDDYVIDISPKYKIKGCSRLATDGSLYRPTPFHYDLEDLRFATLSYFVSYGGSKGNIKNFSNSYMTRLYLRYCSEVVGDISVMSTCMSPSTALLDLGSTGLYGDVSALSHLQSMTDLRINNTEISGNVSALASLTALTNISLRNSAVSGEISSFGGMDQLSSLDIRDTKIGGEIQGIANMQSLYDLHVNETVSGDFYDLVVAKRGLLQLSGSMNVYNSVLPPNRCTFRGRSIKPNPYGNLYLRWDDHKAALTASDSWNASLIYVYGATQEELDAWEDAGKTVYVLD